MEEIAYSTGWISQINYNMYKMGIHLVPTYRVQQWDLEIRIEK